MGVWAKSQIFFKIWLKSLDLGVWAILYLCHTTERVGTNWRQKCFAQNAKYDQTTTAATVN